MPANIVIGFLILLGAKPFYWHRLPTLANRACLLSMLRFMQGQSSFDDEKDDERSIDATGISTQSALAGDFSGLRCRGRNFRSVVVMKGSQLAEAKRADSWQSTKALLIPFSLFLACVVSAAGSFLIYHEEPLGWAFLFVGGATILLAFVGLIRFQNQFRARGIVIDDGKDDDEKSEPDEMQCLETR